MSTTQTEQTAVRYDKDADGIVTLTLDDPTASANTMNELYLDVDGRRRRPAVRRGATSRHRRRGHQRQEDLLRRRRTSTRWSRPAPPTRRAVFALAERVKAALRRLETFPKPVVAAINGAALGGGFEIALACNHRIVVDGELRGRAARGHPRPAARRRRRHPHRPAARHPERADGRAAPGQHASSPPRPRRRAWSTSSSPPRTSWSRPRRPGSRPTRTPYRTRGTRPATRCPAARRRPRRWPASCRRSRRCCASRSRARTTRRQKAILSAAVEGAQVDFDTATPDRVALPDQPDRQPGLEEHDPGVLLRPAGDQRRQAPPAGHRAVEGDQGRRPRRRDDGRRHRLRLRPRRHGGRAQGRRRRERREGQGLLGEAARQGDLPRPLHRGEEGRAARPDHRHRRPGRPGRLRPGDRGRLRGPGAQGEGVRRDRAARATRTRCCAPTPRRCRSPSSRRASTGPRTSSACTSSRPVDKMPLVEIIKGEQTSDEALAKAYDVVQQIRKTPIVVNDSRGFYTSRVIGFMVNEGMAMLAEGVHPYSIERADHPGRLPGAGAAALRRAQPGADGQDREGDQGRRRARGQARTRAPRHAVVDTMLEAGRAGRLRGAGFYDYDENGNRGSIWPGLAELFPVAEEQLPFARHQGPDAVRRGARDREVLRGGRHRVRRRREHRLDHGHRLPADDRWRRPVHDGLPGPGELRRPDRPRGVPRAGRRARRGVRRPVPATPWLRDLAAKGEAFPA